MSQDLPRSPKTLESKTPSSAVKWAGAYEMGICQAAGLDYSDCSDYTMSIQIYRYIYNVYGFVRKSSTPNVKISRMIKIDQIDQSSGLKGEEGHCDLASSTCLHPAAGHTSALRHLPRRVHLCRHWVLYVGIYIIIHRTLHVYFTCIYIYSYIYILIYILIYIYIYIFLYIYTHIYILLYIYS